MDFNKFFQSKTFAAAVFVLAIVILLLLAFKAGMIVGTKKADFSCHWSDNYHRNFGGPKEGFFRGLGDRDFMEANGIVGQIIKIEGGNLVIKGKNNVEKIILVNAESVINRLRGTITLADLKIDDVIVTIGEPNEFGQITAKLIRVLPPTPQIQAPFGNFSVPPPHVF